MAFHAGNSLIRKFPFAQKFETPALGYHRYVRGFVLLK